MVEAPLRPMYFNFFQLFYCFRLIIINSIHEQAAAAWALYGTWWLAIYSVRSTLCSSRDSVVRLRTGLCRGIPPPSQVFSLIMIINMILNLFNPEIGLQPLFRFALVAKQSRSHFRSFRQQSTALDSSGRQVFSCTPIIPKNSFYIYVSSQIWFISGIDRYWTARWSK